MTDPVDGVWHIRFVAATAPCRREHTLCHMTVAPRPTTPLPPPPSPGAPAFVNYAAPENIPPSLGSTDAGQHGAGEPSIGVDWNTGKAFIAAGNHTLRVTFNDTVTPATSTWEDKRSPFARVSLDPILFTDDGHFGGTNRLSLHSSMESPANFHFTDDDGDDWLPTQGSGQPAGVDHQTVGGGPSVRRRPAVHTYPHAIYYCSKTSPRRSVRRSDDGGLTFGPGVPIYTFTTVNGVDRPVAPGTCGGLHGHVRVSPDDRLRSE